MIRTPNNKKSLEFISPLIKYIREKHAYHNEKLMYTTRYTGGTFSITNPTSDYRDCILINGYPHFNIPLDVCLEEIYYFLNNADMYDFNFLIRYGDTHPHKTTPKLSQTRNLLIENSISSMIGSKAASYYVLGDISIKSLSDFITKYGINITPENLFIQLANWRTSSEINALLNMYDKNALAKISEFLKKLKLGQKEFLIESSLYQNTDLYIQIKNNPEYHDELKKNGELKYTLQEMMFIKQLLKNPDDVLISIIGANQIDHVMKVNGILASESPDIRSRFLTYDICKNGDERNVEIWSTKLNEYIKKNNLRIGGNYIGFDDLLKILIITNSNDVIIDFAQMEKYGNAIRRFNEIVNDVTVDDDNIPCIITENNDLICMMALVTYQLNQAIESGNQNQFYRYLLSIISEYEKNEEKYKNIKSLYQVFVINCINRLGYSIGEERKERCKVLTNGLS